jgi:hypothetical protein
MVVVSLESKNSMELKNANRLGTPTGNGSWITTGNSIIFKHTTDALEKSWAVFSTKVQFHFSPVDSQASPPQPSV